MGYFYDSTGKKTQVTATPTTPVQNSVAVEHYTGQDLEIKTNSDNLVGWVGTLPMTTLLFYIAILYIVLFSLWYAYSKMKSQ